MPFLIGSKDDQADQAILVDSQEGFVLYQMITRQPAEVPPRGVLPVVRACE